MTEVEHHSFDIEVLEQRTFERSKTWAKALDEFVRNETGVELKVDEFDEIFQSDDESDGHDLDGTHAQFDDEALEVWEASGKADDTQKHYPQSKQDLALMFYGDHDNDGNKTELKDILDQTLPILAEHKRKWEEAGIERVLKTFDAKKIEKQVGEWLRLNNSAYSEKSLICTPANMRSATKRFNQCRERELDSDESDAESMHSVDTARYIRSSRKNHGHHRSVSSHCTTMTIKTYRMVKSKRDELRKKYGCPEYDEDHRHRMQEVKCRRLQKQQRDCDSSYCQGKELQKISDGHHISQRRKQLRKRRSNSSMLMLSSEEEFDDSLMFYQQANGHYKTKSPRHCCSMQRSVCVYRQDRSPFSSYRNASSHSVRHIERRFQRELSYEDDRRPYKRESECRCCNDNQLCESVRHLVNSSTEEWLVENSDTFENTKSSKNKSQSKVKFAKELSTLGNQKTFKNMITSNEGNRNLMEYFKLPQTAHTSESRTEAIPYPIKTPNKSIIKTKSHDDSKKVETNEIIPYPIKTPNKSITKSKSLSESKKVETIVGSQQQPKDQKPKKQSQRKVQINTSNDESVAPKSRSKLSKKQNETEKASKEKPKTTSLDKNNEENEDDFEKELQRALKLSKQQYKLEQKKKKQKSCETSVKEVKTKENVEKTQEGKIKKKLNSSAMKSENTFLTNSSNMCNSTALAHDTAGDREFSRKPVKRVAAVSTTNFSNSSSSMHTSGSSSKLKETPAANKTHKKPKSTKNQNNDDDNDCTIVSSTTGMDVPTQATQNKPKPAQPTMMPTATSEPKMPNDKQTQKGILLYAPTARDLAPSHSFQNGYFNITEEHLSSVIGKNAARKFLKCYIGRRRFDTSSTVYYRPPANESVADAHANMDVDSSDSDDDILDNVGRCGELYESLEK